MAIAAAAHLAVRSGGRWLGASRAKGGRGDDGDAHAGCRQVATVRPAGWRSLRPRIWRSDPVVGGLERVVPREVEETTAMLMLDVVRLRPSGRRGWRCVLPLLLRDHVRRGCRIVGSLALVAFVGGA